MIKKLFYSQGTGVASFVLAVATFISYVFGLVRDKVMAYYFGASELTDAYNSAFLLPDFIFNLFIAGALSGIFIPIFIQEKNKGEDNSDNLGSSFLTIMSLFILIISIVAFIFTPNLIGLFVNISSFSQSGQDTLISLTRIMLVSPILFGLSNTLGSILLAYNHFTAYSLSPALYNLGIILGIVIFAPFYGIYGAAIGVVIGLILHLAIRLWNMKYVKFKFKWRFDYKNVQFIKILIYMIPRTIALITTQIILIEFSYMGSLLDKGSYSASVYARNFQSFAISLFGIALATAVLPALSELAIKKSKDLFQLRLERSMRQILYITIPAAIGMILLAYPIIKVILGGGEFHEQDVQTTSFLLLIFAFSIPFESLMHLYSRAFYAIQKVFIPMIAGILFFLVASGVMFSKLYSNTLVVNDLAYAWTLGMVVQFLVLYIIFHHVEKITKMNYKRLFSSIFKMIIATVAMGLFVYSIHFVTSSNVLILTVGVTGGALIYFFISHFLKSEEISVVSLLLNKITKK